MNALRATLLFVALASASAYANETVPAWQTPGYVLNEIVVTMRRPAAQPESGPETARPEIPEICI